MYITQQRVNFTGKSSNDNSNADDNHGKNRKFGENISKPGKEKGKHDELGKNHTHRDDQKK